MKPPMPNNASEEGSGTTLISRPLNAGLFEPSVAEVVLEINSMSDAEVKTMLEEGVPGS